MNVMKRYLFLIAALIVIFFPTRTFALTNNPNGDSLNAKLQQRLELREEKLLEIQNRIQNRELKTASREARLTELRQNLIKKYYLQMSKRLWATIDRLDVLITRIDARIKIFDAETDDDLTAVNTDINQAKSLLTETRAILVSSDGMIDTATLSGSPKESFDLIKLNIQEIKDDLKEVHGLLVHVIGDLEGLRVGTTEMSPTTP